MRRSAVRRGAVIALAVAVMGCSDGGGDALPTGDDPAAAGSPGTAVVTIDGTTFVTTEASTCDVGTEFSPDDRVYVGRSSDGTIELSIGAFAFEQMQQFNGVTLDVEGVAEGGGEAGWSWQLATEPSFEAEATSDGASGTSAVGSVGFGDDGQAIAEFSFTC